MIAAGKPCTGCGDSEAPRCDVNSVITLCEPCATERYGPAARIMLSFTERR